MAASRSNAACAHPDEHRGKRRSEDPPPPRRCAGSVLGSPYPGRPTAAHSTHRHREPRQRPQPTFGNAEEETRTGTSVSGTRWAVGPGTPRVDTRHARLRASRAGGCPTIPRGAVGSTADDDHRPWGKRPARTPLRRRQRRSRATGIACVVVMPRLIHPPPRVSGRAKAFGLRGCRRRGPSHSTGSRLRGPEAHLLRRPFAGGRVGERDRVGLQAGKPRRASGVGTRPRVFGATDFRADQGPGVELALPANDRGA